MKEDLIEKLNALDEKIAKIERQRYNSSLEASTWSKGRYKNDFYVRAASLMVKGWDKELTQLHEQRSNIADEINKSSTER